MTNMKFKQLTIALSAITYMLSVNAAFAAANSPVANSPTINSPAAPKDCRPSAFTGEEGATYDLKHSTIHMSGPMSMDVPAVIFIPGLSSPRDVWDAAAEAHHLCYRVYTVQLRGFGDDAGPNAEQQPLLEPFIEELAVFIRENDLKKPMIVGHSMGGLSALMIGARHPELPGKIMVVDAVPFIGTLFNPNATTEMVQAQAQAMSDGIRATYKVEKPPFDGKEPGAQSPSGFYSNSATGRTLVAKWTYEADARVTAHALYDVLTTDMRSELPKITAPVTLLYAQDDSAMTAEAAGAAFVPQYAGTPKFKSMMISGSRHFIMLDQPEKFAAALEAFLAK
jgi:pimeloyl-ACP methyl ester carboxylesterase